MPTLSSSSPPSGLPNTTVPVTLSGTNFVIGATVVGISTTTDIVVSGVDVTSATSLNASFTIDPAAPFGPRNVNVTTTGGTSNNVTFTVAMPTIILTPNPVSVGIAGVTPVTVSVNRTVPPGPGIDIVVTSAATGIATVLSPAHIAPGYTSTTVNVTGVAVGDTTLNATLAGYNSGSTGVHVTTLPQPVVNLSPPSLAFNATGSATQTVTRANDSIVSPLDVTLSVDRPGYFTFPATVTMPGGQTSQTFTINGSAVDASPPVTLSAKASGHVSGLNTLVSVQILLMQMTPAVLVNPGQSVPIQIVLSAAAPPGGVTVNLNNPSLNTGIATVTRRQ